MTPHPGPALAATIDQTQTANRQAAEILAAMFPGVVPESGPLTGTPAELVDRMLDQLGRLLAAGEPMLCEHARWAAPAPLVWLPWAPALLRCLGCADPVMREIHGTALDRRCDRCHRTAATVHPAGAQLAPVVITPDLVVPPVLVLYGLCPTCRTGDDPAQGLGDGEAGL